MKEDPTALTQQLNFELELLQARLDGLHNQAAAITTIVHRLSITLSTLQTRVTTMRTELPKEHS